MACAVPLSSQNSPCTMSLEVQFCPLISAVGMWSLMALFIINDAFFPPSFLSPPFKIHSSHA